MYLIWLFLLFFFYSKLWKKKKRKMKLHYAFAFCISFDLVHIMQLHFCPTFFCLNKENYSFENLLIRIFWWLCKFFANKTTKKTLKIKSSNWYPKVHNATSTYFLSRISRYIFTFHKFFFVCLFVLLFAFAMRMNRVTVFFFNMIK